MPDLCNRCLVNVNVTITIRAHWRPRNAISTFEDCGTPQSPRQLASWVERMMVQGADDISIGDMPDAFDPVSTWHGDPVCAGHLFELREREQRHA